MNDFFPGRFVAIFVCLTLAMGLDSSSVAEQLDLKVTTPAPPNSAGFNMGTAQNPEGGSIGINSRCLTRDGKPWMPVMGEFHFSRCPAEEWREELLRMKAGGIDIAASYVFWNHHEEIEGTWDWSGRKNLRKFIETCNEVGILAAVRVGPWCHGEVRNGGIPDWAVNKKWKLRSNDPQYLAQVRILYDQIATQLQGLYWKDGGPIVAIQLDNEYRGPAEHLLELKKIAREVGMDVPLYTRTGWPELGSPMPFGEIAPLYGAYAEGFWDRSLRSMPGKYWAGFRFMHVRTDAAIATEQLGERKIRDESGAEAYPFLTCELGGGMMSSYHRRLLIQPADIEAVALAKIGSGGNLPGYYMYHGGVNPEGKLTTLMEQQSAPMTNYNDMPEKNYDFQAPLGSFGQTRPHYHRLRRLHLLFRDFGQQLAAMPSFLPERLPGKSDDHSTLRWAVRSNGSGGFLFVNNHQRGTDLADHTDVQFVIDSAGETFTIPDSPCNIKSGSRFIWPFGLELCDGVELEYATAQLICKIDDADTRTLFFAETPGVPARFVFSDGTVEDLEPSRSIAMKLTGDGTELRIVLLSDSDSLQCWKGKVAGRDRVVLSQADAIFDENRLVLRADKTEHLQASIFPALDPTAEQDGVFGNAQLEIPPTPGFEVTVEQIQPAGEPRTVALGRSKVAAAPDDEDFRDAARFRIGLPKNFDPSNHNGLLRIRYHGDVARVRIGDRLVMDDYFNGLPLEVGSNRFASQLNAGEEITLEILPFPSNAPIFYPETVDQSALDILQSVELVPRLTVEISK